MVKTSTKIAGSTAALAAAAATGMAGDAAAAAPVPYTQGWDGFYVGGSLGASWLTSKPDGSTETVTLVEPFGGTVTGGNKSTSSGKATNWLAGLHFGHNWQQNKFVYGFEVDLKWFGSKNASANGSMTTTYSLGPQTYAASTHRDSRVQAETSFRGRFGYDFNGTLPYVTAGVALGRIKSTWNFVGTGGVPFPPGTESFTASKTSWVPGLVVGGGVEQKLWDHWSIRGEVLWTKFADQTLSNPVFSATYAAHTGSGGTIKFRDDITTATIGLSYRF